MEKLGQRFSLQGLRFSFCLKNKINFRLLVCGNSLLTGICLFRDVCKSVFLLENCSYVAHFAEVASVLQKNTVRRVMPTAFSNTTCFVLYETR